MKKYVAIYFKGHTLNMSLAHYNKTWKPCKEKQGYKDQKDFWRLI